MHNKQKNIDNLLNMISYIHTNPNKFGANSNKNTDAMSAQINLIAGKGFKR